jgi:hypothetical protein
MPGVNEAVMTSKTALLPGDAVAPLTVTVAKACEISGFGPTSIWGFVKDRKLEAVRVPGVRRTLIRYQSLMRLLGLPVEAPPPRRRGRPGKRPATAGVHVS